MIRIAASLVCDLFSLCAVNSQLVSLRCQFASFGGLIESTVPGANRIARCDSQVFPSISFSVLSAPSSYILGQYPVFLYSLKGTVCPF